VRVLYRFDAASNIAVNLEGGESPVWLLDIGIEAAGGGRTVTVKGCSRLYATKATQEQQKPRRMSTIHEARASTSIYVLGLEDHDGRWGRRDVTYM
jgi:hypothetical protein